MLTVADIYVHRAGVVVLLFGWASIQWGCRGEVASRVATMVAIYTSLQCSVVDRDEVRLQEWSLHRYSRLQRVGMPLVPRIWQYFGPSVGLVRLRPSSMG